MNERPRERAVEDRLRELLQDYHQPPRELDTQQRERMWQQIRAQQGASGLNSRRRSPGPHPGWRKSQLWWPVTAAALLVLGLVIGRQLPEQPVSNGESPVPQRVQQERWSQSTADALFRLVAQQVLRRSETLLTEYRHTEAVPSTHGDAAQWAGQLLVQTRLLIDSPAAQDPQLRHLLRDLELILAQIVQATDDSSERERAWIREGLERRSILLRLRNEITPAETAPKGA